MPNFQTTPNAHCEVKSTLVRERSRIVPPPDVVSEPTRNGMAAQLEIEHVPIVELNPYPKGLRKHTEKHIAACMGSLRSFGFVAPVLIDSDDVVVDGHALVIAAERLGFAEVPVVRLSHLSPDLIKACRIAINKLSEGGEWDGDALRLELIDIAPSLVADDIEVEALGFSMAEFDMMLALPEAAEEDEPVVDVEKVAVSAKGDLWMMGEHRLLCGSALEPDDFVKLMDGEKARMAFCDPPYNLKVDGVISGLGKVKHREFAMGSGEMSRPDFIAFLTTYMRTAPPTRGRFDPFCLHGLAARSGAGHRR